MRGKISCWFEAESIFLCNYLDPADGQRDKMIDHKFSIVLDPM